ncbi:hypothetical protein CQW23_34901 [Capsicum baccatum]|uniref:Uncharacterized protein n=1 Tax=Capsicum baccatum TaxID=33114 RepID=A0A2G2UXL8_CAPBA|nr:hypothetical protein CQW23_34901 [Capsicum baccatum]
MMYNGKSHHIRGKHNIVRELLSSGIITVDYVKSKDNVSDSLTKGLSREGVERTSKEMGLRPRTSGHAKTLMFAHVSPEGDSFGETISTLKFPQGVPSVELGAARLNKESIEVLELKAEIETLKKVLANKQALTPQTNKPKEASRTPFQKPKATAELQEGYNVTKLYDQAGNDSFMKTPPSQPFAFRSQDTPQTPASGIKYQQAPRSPTSGFKSQQPPRSPTSGFKSKHAPRSQLPPIKVVKTTDNRTRIPCLQLPKTPKPLITSISENKAGMQSNHTISSEFQKPLTSSTHRKGSQIRRSLRIIEKLINGSDRKYVSYSFSEVQHCDSVA